MAILLTRHLSIVCYISLLSCFLKIQITKPYVFLYVLLWAAIISVLLWMRKATAKLYLTKRIGSVLNCQVTPDDDIEKSILAGVI